jgi:glycine hydroxymethyltransferase
MNLRPNEPLGNVSNPTGIRLGVQEMTRFGMKKKEMETIAELFKKCLIDGKYVGEEVKEFRAQFQRIQYSFDQSSVEI